jgi:hypothetical protein
LQGNIQEKNVTCLVNSECCQVLLIFVVLTLLYIAQSHTISTLLDKMLKFIDERLHMRCGAYPENIINTHQSPAGMRLC